MFQHIQKSNTMKNQFIPFSTINQYEPINQLLLCGYLIITNILLEHDAKIERTSNQICLESAKSSGYPSIT